VVYVDGPIVPGAPQPGLFGSDGIAFSTPIRRALDEVARDETFKAVVLRVSSPGGSAVASEIILNATKRAKAQKPFVVSMGDVAGSGGYYVACGADTIFAGRSTMTGSIGVVGGKLSTGRMWNKLGVNWKPIQRGANAGILSASEPFTDAQREQLHAWMQEIYEVFKGHVRAARGARLKKDIEELAGGRVYTGNQALELGLIDRIGGLDDAIQFVAKQAKIDEFEVQVMPRPKSFMEIVFADLKEPDSDSKYLEIAQSDPVLQPARSLMAAVLPILAQLEPRRAQATAAAFWQLAMLGDERALLVMPQILIGM
jgi:protease-4